MSTIDAAVYIYGRLGEHERALTLLISDYLLLIARFFRLICSLIAPTEQPLSNSGKNSESNNSDSLLDGYASTALTTFSYLSNHKDTANSSRRSGGSSSEGKREAHGNGSSSEGKREAHSSKEELIDVKKRLEKSIQTIKEVCLRNPSEVRVCA